ncbi:PhzF family phenazine biosynthesis protein [Rheinheimera texasensis]|uniref:PhzF family phenazine biosynthesis protein n=1 Tax=Rheinheimera texasensis TaxID=306205 RepID=UPI00068CBF94|nr:PhzF family phenazine biosynthesis protein [Rheinheimera texasensis]
MENMQAFVLDVFCSDVASGNPAAVCVLTTWPEDSVLQTFAATQSVPVIAFVLLPPAQTAPQPIPVRWFAGTQEINLCGHGSLAAGAVVLEQGPAWPDAKLTSRFGDISITRSKLLLPELAAGHQAYAMCLPAWPAQKPVTLAQMTDRLNLSAQGLVLTDCFATRDLILVLETASQVQAFVPDFAALRQLQPYHATILTAPLFAADGQTITGYVLRYFAPNIGINEDLATGSAQCSLAPYWLARSGTTRLQVQQLSSAGGYFVVEAQSADQICVHAAVRSSKGPVLSV